MVSKYHNVKTVVDGHVFASRAEASRYAELRLLERAGEIFQLQLQKRLKLEVCGVLVCTYIADFIYLTAAGDPVFEDVKGVKTAVYQLKKKLVKAVYGIDIVEIGPQKGRKHGKRRR
jgi:hypothetical protein